MHKVHLDKFAYGGQAIGTLDSGKKVFVWGGLPGETITIDITRERAHYCEAIVRDVIKASSERTTPRDPSSYLATSPWQIVDFNAELGYKAQLTSEAFRQQGIELASESVTYSDGRDYFYRNKYQFYWTNTAIFGVDTLDVAYIDRNSNTRMAFDQCSLPMQPIMELAIKIRDMLRTQDIKADELDSLIIRSDQSGGTTWQLIATTKRLHVTDSDISALSAQGGEVLYRDPRHREATKILQTVGDTILSDTINSTSYRYRADSFFQINLPVYTEALNDIKNYVRSGEPLVDLYSGVGTISLTVGGSDITLVERDHRIENEIAQNIISSGKAARAVLTSTESALDYISSRATIIVDPPRAGLAKPVIDRLLDTEPPRIIYLSCNPITQARDAKSLASAYHIVTNRSYDFFPHTPHIENLIILDRNPS